MSFLFKITSPSKVESYLFGTIHKNEEKFCLLSTEAKCAFEDARVVIGEQAYDDMYQVGLQLPNKINVWRAALLANGENHLGDYLSYSQIKVIAAELGWNKLPFDELNEKFDVPPVWLYTSLTNKLQALQQESNSTAFFNSPLILDFALMQRAGELGKQLISLDTIEEKLSIMIGEIFTYEQQVQYWNEQCEGSFSLDEIKKNLFKQNQKLCENYLSGSMDQLMKFLEERLLDLKPLTRQLLNYMISQRDELFVERLEPILKDKKAFIAMCAFHLQGVVKLLQERGFQVEFVAQGKKEHAIQKMTNTNADVEEDSLVSYYNRVSSHVIQTLEFWKKYINLVEHKKITNIKPIQFIMTGVDFSYSAVLSPVTESDCTEISKLLAQSGQLNVSAMSMKFTDVPDAPLIKLLDEVHAKFPGMKLILDFTERNVSETLFKYLQELIASYPAYAHIDIKFPEGYKCSNEFVRANVGNLECTLSSRNFEFNRSHSLYRY